MRAFDLTVSGSLILSGSMKNQDGNSIVSNSAQIGSNISGSLGANAAVIRTLDRTTLSGSLGANAAVIRTLDRTTLSGSLGANAAVIRSLNRTTISGSIPQPLATNSSPTFAAGTITGDFSVGGILTAQEVHTEFESASILFTSGSTKFGDTIDDIHQLTGSFLMTGSMAVGTGRGITPNGIFDVGLNTDGTRRFSVSFEDSLVSLSAKNQSNNGEVLKLMGDGLRIHTGTNTSGTEKIRVDGTGNLGIGTNNPSHKLDILENAETNVVRFFNDGGDQNRDVMILQGGADEGPGNTRFITFNDGNGGTFGCIQGPGSGATAGISFNTTADTSLLTLSGSRVGIGITNPADLLDIQGGNLRVRVGGAGAIHLQNDGSNHSQILANNNGGTTTVQLKTSGVSFFNGGNVGIGTDSPDATLDLRGTQKIQTNTVPASLIVGTNDTTDHTGQDTALAIDFRNLSTTNGVAGGIVGLDKDGLELSKILLVTDNHDANTSSIRMFTSTNAAQRTQMVNINNDGVTVGGGASAQRALHVQGTTGLCLSDGDRDRAALLPVSPDADTGHMQFNTRSGGASRERMRLTSTGNLCVGPSGSAAGFTPSLTVTGTNPSLGLRLQDGNSGTFFNTVLSSDGNSIKTFYSQAYSLASAANDGGTSENSRFTLDTSGNVSIDGNLTEGSDIRLKTNIEKIPDVLDILDEIKPVKFEWKEDVEEGIEKKHIGLIAQEVEPHFPELIYEGTTRDTEETTYKGLNYPGLTPILLKAVQELSSKVNELQQKIEELEK